MTMQNPPHPGEVVAEYLGSQSVADAASKLGVGQEYLSRLLDRQASIDSTMAAKLGRLFGTSADLWMGLQSAHDLNKFDSELLHATAHGLPPQIVRDIRSSLDEVISGNIQPYTFGSPPENSDE